MKKLLLTSAILASSLISFAQTPAVPNGGFEDWSDASCEEAPTGYSSIADQIFENDGICPTSSGISKSTNAYSGVNALELKSAVYLGTTVGNLVAVTSETFDGRPTKLVGYTKFTKGGTDVLNIFVGLSSADEETEIAYGEATITATQSDYVRFEITLDYFDNTTTPGFFYIGIELGTTTLDENEEETLTGDAASIALIDAFSFEYPTTTPTVSYSATSPINVYAASKNINFSENVSDVHVVDMVGAQKISETANTKILNAASLTTGMYIVTYKYNNAYYSKKVVIE